MTNDINNNKTAVYLTGIIILFLLGVGVLLIQPYKQTELNGQGQASIEITLKNYTIPLSEIIRLVNPEATNSTIELEFGEVTIKSNVELDLQSKNLDWLLKELTKASYIQDRLEN